MKSLENNLNNASCTTLKFKTSIDIEKKPNIDANKTVDNFQGNSCADKSIVTTHEEVTVPSVSTNCILPIDKKNAPVKCYPESQTCAKKVGERETLRVTTIRKIIRRFLVEKKMPKEKLIETLGITIENLELLFSQKIPPELILKINLPLIKLYCETKWI